MSDAITAKMLNDLAQTIKEVGAKPDTIIVSKEEYEEHMHYAKTGELGPILTRRLEAIKNHFRGKR